MKIIKPSITIIKELPEQAIYKKIERFGRICYKSEGKITDNSYEAFIKSIIKRNHLSVIEHVAISAIVTCDRGVTHEIVRHRIGSYSQESTRYCNYNKSEIEFIDPLFWSKEQIQYSLWKESMLLAEASYKELIKQGATAQEARSVLPNSLASEIGITYNLREWKHFFELRCPPTAHPQMREVAFMLLEELYKYLPLIFENEYNKFIKEKNVQH